MDIFPDYDPDEDEGTQSPSPEPAAYAKRILVHYFEKAFEFSGKPWDSDYTAEIEGAIDDLIFAAVVKANR